MLSLRNVAVSRGGRVVIAGASAEAERGDVVALFDEPLGGLDIEGTRILVRILRTLSDRGRIVVAAAVGLTAASAVLILSLTGIPSAAGDLLRRRLRLRPIEGWYWRVIRARRWLLVYLLVLPVILSSFVSPGAKRITFTVFALFAVLSYLQFVARCEVTLREKWRCSLTESGNLRFLAGSLLTHAVLVAVPPPARGRSRTPFESPAC